MTTLLPFQHDRRILHAPRLCYLKKETIGGNATRENRRSVNLRVPQDPKRAPRDSLISGLHRYQTSPNAPDNGRRDASSYLPRAIARQESFRVISTARLRTLPPVHLPPIYVVVCNDPNGDLILRLASCLDAFSTYPYPTRLPGRAPGGTTGWPEVGPTRSSRTSVRSPQISNAHNR